MNFDKERQKVLNAISSLEGCFKQWEVSLPVIPKLFDEEHKKSVYRLFGDHVESFQSVESLAYSLHHAFVDDGDYHISKTPDEKLYEYKLGLSDRLESVPPPEMSYIYSLEGGDSDTNIDEDELDLILDVDQLQYKYYEKFSDEITTRVEGVRKFPYFSEEHKEWDRLKNLTNILLGDLYKIKFDWNNSVGVYGDDEDYDEEWGIMRKEGEVLMQPYRDEVVKVNKILENI